MKLIYYLFFICLSSKCILAQNSLTKAADSLYALQQWQLAYEEYNKILKLPQNNARNYFRAANCMHQLKNYKNSLPYYRKAAEIGNNTTIFYNFACVFSQLNMPDSAFYWLKKAAHLGFNQYQNMITNKELESLQSNPIFTDILQEVKNNDSPCETAIAYRQFDFVIGKWQVYNSMGILVGNVTFERSLGDCALIGNGLDTQGTASKSFNIFNASYGTWQQTYLDDKGNVIEYIDGIATSNSMVFNTSRPIYRKDGLVVLKRVSFFKNQEGGFRQLGEISKDEGKNWQTEFDLLYQPELNVVDMEYVNKEVAKGKKYWLVFLNAGKLQMKDTAEAEKMQEEHLKFLFSMHQQGKLAIFGPVLKPNSVLRGIAIFTIESKEELVNLLNLEPLIKVGRLTYEILPWFSVAGHSLP